MTTIGLTLIALAWVIQLNEVLKKKTKISPIFLALYSLGVFFLSVTGYQEGHIFEPILNSISIIAAAFIFLKLQK